MKRQNSILIIAGPSGVGKTVIAEAIRAKNPAFDFIRSATTRQKRGDSHDGEYLYFTDEEFDRAIANDDILEYMEYAGAKYGTPRCEVNRAIAEGKIPLLVLDLVGVRSMAEKQGFSPCSVYVWCDNEIVTERLYNRYLGAGENEKGRANFNTRNSRNLSDFAEITDYEPYFFTFVKNDGTVEECRDRIMAIFDDFCNGAQRDDALCQAVGKMVNDMI